jgi:hypothetical protein
MADNYYINDDRSKVFIGYLSEPILAEASARILNLMGDEYRPKVIDHISNAMCEGIINQGDNGELAAEIILLRAMDKACDEVFKKNPQSNIKYGAMVPLKDFLCKLIGFEKYNEIYEYYKDASRLGQEKIDLLVNGKICFNHFIEESKSLEGNETAEDRKKRLIRFAMRFGAMRCRRIHKLTDFEIPVFIGENLNEITYVLIQVKCTVDADIGCDWIKISPETLGYEIEEHTKPFLVIWMELGSLDSVDCNAGNTNKLILD